MSFKDLREFIRHLEARGDLVRIRTEVDPDQEVTVIQHRVIAEEGPALLFERVKGSAHPILINMFGTRNRVDDVFGGAPEKLGNDLTRVIRLLTPPSMKGLWRAKQQLFGLASARMRHVGSGPIMERITEPPDLTRLPVLTCWPEDGGPFFTLPLVHTRDPEEGRGNLGIYRLQRFDARTTGMHWQIEKGGGFHFNKAAGMGAALPVSVVLGGPPALIIAAIAPFPEGLDERLLAAYLTGAPLKMIARRETGHEIPALAEFVLEGTVTPGDERMEGPFGDHFGHYSHAAKYPVFRVRRVLARRDAIYPATVVGKPIQEDYYIGEALQKMTLPLLRLIRPAVCDLWAYPETGFHCLAVMSVQERYPKEALKHTLGMLGEGQVSLTKVMITVGTDVDVKNFEAVSRALWHHLDPETGIHLISPTAQDTLDFTGPKINTGSRLILMAVNGLEGPLRREEPPPLPHGESLDEAVLDTCRLGPSFLIVRMKDEGVSLERIQEKLNRHPVARQYLFHVLVSADIPLDNRILTLWGWFTRFDPLADLHPAERRLKGNRAVLDFPILIDARWKTGYPKPVEFDPEIERRVNDRWKRYGVP